MATKRIKSFSPYSYSIQYAKAGEGPAQKPHPYVNMAILPEEHFVIAKKDPNWYVYVANTAIYNLDDECNLNIDRVKSEMTIIEKTEKMDEHYKSDMIEIEELGSTTVVIDLLRNDNVTWTSSNSAEILYALNSDVDCIVLANNEHVKISKKYTNSNRLNIFFKDDFNKSSYSSLIAVVYEIDNEQYRVKRTDDFNFDRINNVLSFSNDFMSNKCVPMIFDENNKSYIFENIDLTPNRVLVDSSNIETIQRVDVENELNSINEEISQIQNENSMVPSAFLYEHNEEYRQLIERRVELNNALDRIGSKEIYVNAKNAILYTYNSPNVYFSIKYGINDSNVTWVGNAAVINHNLNGYVNVIVDDTLHSNTSYRIFDVSLNQIKIQFSNPRYAVCSVRIFKIGGR